jgi:NADPH-dependent 7-cyano-7-deazaguanine reductase QueF
MIYRFNMLLTYSKNASSLLCVARHLIGSNYAQLRQFSFTKTIYSFQASLNHKANASFCYNTGRPDWANFRLLAIIYFGTFFLKITE